eukprot:g1769.t1
MSDPYSSSSSSSPYSGKGYDQNMEMKNESYVDPFAGIGNVDLSKLQGTEGNAEYLDGFNEKGRSIFERLSYNTGICYMSGTILGGLYGGVEGLQNAPSNKFKIRLNSFLNVCGKRGSRAGNSLATLAMMFSFLEWGVENAEIDHYLPKGTSSFAIPITAGVATGVLYKCTRGPKLMTIYGLVGGSVMAGLYGGSRLLGKQLKNVVM